MPAGPDPPAARSLAGQIKYVAGEEFELVIRNRRFEDTQLEVVETVLDTWEFSSRELHALDRDEGLAVVRLTVGARVERSLRWALVKHSGTRIPKTD
jgi:hypothetical protein